MPAGLVRGKSNGVTEPDRFCDLTGAEIVVVLRADRLTIGRSNAR